MAKTKNTITYDFINDDGDEEYIDVPAKWEICSDCSGEGESSAYLGAITMEDRERDWSPDEFEDYMRGGYDKTCDGCSGTGKIRVPDYDALDPETRKRIEDKEQDDAEYEAMCRAERRMGA